MLSSTSIGSCSSSQTTTLLVSLERHQIDLIDDIALFIVILSRSRAQPLLSSTPRALWVSTLSASSPNASSIIKIGNCSFGMLGRASSIAKGTTSYANSGGGRACCISSTAISDSGNYEKHIRCLLELSMKSWRHSNTSEFKIIIIFLTAIIASTRNFLFLRGTSSIFGIDFFFIFFGDKEIPFLPRSSLDVFLIDVQGLTTGMIVIFPPLLLLLLLLRHPLRLS